MLRDAESQLELSELFEPLGICIPCVQPICTGRPVQAFTEVTWKTRTALLAVASVCRKAAACLQVFGESVLGHIRDLIREIEEYACM